MASTQVSCDDTVRPWVMKLLRPTANTSTANAASMGFSCLVAGTRSLLSSSGAAKASSRNRSKVRKAWMRGTRTIG